MAGERTNEQESLFHDDLISLLTPTGFLIDKTSAGHSKQCRSDDSGR